MPNIYNNKWIRQILDLQQVDGSCGHFHTLSKPTKNQPITTEQALRRLRVLGLSAGDKPIDKALEYMRCCLKGEIQPPDGREKVLNWDTFEAHMMSAWIRIFVPEDSLAMPVARMWAEIISYSFKNGVFNEKVYADEYRKRIPALHSGERMIMLPQFYMVNLLKGMLDAGIESAFVDHIIHNSKGIYYVYSDRIADLPTVFASKQTNGFLAALEQLAGYSRAGEKLKFAVDWLCSYRDENMQWDLGATANDGIYFPISDSWRKQEDRKRDCTARIEKLLNILEEK